LFFEDVIFYINIHLKKTFNAVPLRSEEKHLINLDILKEIT